MKDVFVNLPPGTVRLKGPLGNALYLTVQNRLKKVDYRHLVDPFRFRKEKDGLWRSEFWGKIVRSAIHAWRGTGDPELLTIIRATVSDLLSTQTPDGCISSYPENLQLSGWDIWGRKYVLHALVRYYEEIERSEKVAYACERLLDHLMKQLETSGKTLRQCGEHQGLAASSILDAVVGVYRITGKKRFLEFAREIVRSGCSQKHNIFEAALAGVPPAEIGNGKAYELTSCFQGIAELYRVAPEDHFKEILTAYWRLVEKYEIFITGIGGLKDMGGEYWGYGKWGQTRRDPGVLLGETCVSTTWLRYSDVLLRVTGVSAIADEMERTLYNGILGAMRPDGTGWTHGNPTPLAGSANKRAADDQISGFGEDCCLAQGPEALGMAPLSAVMCAENGMVIHLYEDMEADFATPGKNRGKLEISGGYPYCGGVKIVLNVSVPEEWTLLLRIPSWRGEKSKLKVNGKVCEALSGEYLSLTRIWNDGDCVELDFDLSLRVVRAPDLSRIAFQSGPLVLAQDSRLSDHGEVDLPAPGDCRGKMIPAPEGISSVWELSDGLKLCDYASAGNRFALDNRFTVWSLEKK